MISLSRPSGGGIGFSEFGLSREFSPLSLSPSLWLDGSDSATLLQASGGSSASVDADPVGEWRDKSGNGNHAAQVTASKRPILKVGVQNGRNGILLDGVDDFLLTPSMAHFPSKRGTIFAVYTPTHAAGFTAVISTRDVTVPAIQLYSTRSGTAYKWYDGAGFGVSSSLDGPSATLQTFNRNNDTSAIFRRDTVQETFTLANNQPAANSLGIGAYQTGVAAWFKGNIFEIIYYPVSLNDSQVLQVESYLKSKWGTP